MKLVFRKVLFFPTFFEQMKIKLKYFNYNEEDCDTMKCIKQIFSHSLLLSNNKRGKKSTKNQTLIKVDRNILLFFSVLSFIRYNRFCVRYTLEAI